MFTYSHANTPLGQSGRAYYLSFIKVANVKCRQISNLIFAKGWNTSSTIWKYWQRGFVWMATPQDLAADSKLEPTLNLNSHLLPLFISHRSSGEKLIKYQATSSRLIMSVILMTSLFYKALIFQREIWCWSLLGLKELSQFCTEIITYHKILLYGYKKISNKFQQGTNHNNFLVIFVDISIKTWKTWSNC